MLKSAFIYFPFYFFPRLAAFLVIVIGARILSPSEFGYFSLVTIIGEFADAATTNWVRIALTRFGARSEGLSHAFALRMGGLAIACTLAALLLSSSAAALLAPEKARYVVLAVAAYIPAITLARFGLTLHQAMDSRKRASILESARAALAFLATVTLMAHTGSFLAASLAGSAMTALIGVVAIITGFRFTNRQIPDDTPIKKLLVFALPLVLLALLAQAITNLDKTLLKTFHDAATLGHYSAAFAVGRSGFDVIAAAFNAGVFVRLSTLFNEGKTQEARMLLSRQLAYLLAIALPAAGILIASRDVIAHIIFPPVYYDTFVAVIPLVALGAIALNLKNFVFDNIFHIYLRNFRQIPTLFAGAAVSLGLGLWLLPSGPATGAAFIFAGGGVVSLIMGVALTAPLMRIDMPWRTIIASALLGGLAWAAGEELKNAFHNTFSHGGLLILLGISGCLVTAASLAYTWLSQDEGGRSKKIVLHVISSLGMGGAEKLLCDILETTRQNGSFKYHVLIINDVFDEHLLSRLQKSHATVHLLRRPPGSRDLTYLFKTMLLMRTVRPAIIHCHGTHALLWAWSASIVGRHGKFFLTVHDMRSIPSLGWLMRRLVRALTDRFVAISKAVEADCLHAGLLRTSTVYNGINLATYARVTPSNEAPPLSIITVGRLSTDKKGHDLLIEALALCHREGVHFTARLVGAEADTEAPGARMRLEALARQNGLEPYVTFLGNRSDVPQLLQEADIFVHPSRYEGFGLALVEAMAAGLPVIASDIDGPREILRSGEDGLLFPANDAKALAKALLRIHDNPELYEDMTKKARTRAQDFSIENTILDLETLYFREISPKGPMVMEIAK